jgi:hypothetical protein
LAALPFVDVFTQGESWCVERERAYTHLTPDFYRTIVMRTQYGMPFTFYAYHQYTWRGGKHGTPTPARDVIMMGMQHWNHFNLSDESGLEPSRQIWAFTDPFWASAQFIPYWSDSAPASTGTDGLFCGTYLQADEGRATIFVSNWNRQEAVGTVSLDFAKLGFVPRTMLLQYPLGEPFERGLAVTPKVALDVPARDFRVLVLSR